MVKQLILAVAGSGKTSHLIKHLNLTQRFLLVTYTNNNLVTLKKSILRKFGYHPANIRVMSYFQFLYSFCFKPFFGTRSGAKGISFRRPSDKSRYKTGTDEYYMTADYLMYSNRLSQYCEEESVSIKARLDKYYDYFFVDEVQDFAGRDFNFLMHIIPDKCNTLFVGDFFQHTFDTSNDGNVNITLYEDYCRYINRWKKMGVAVDTTSLSRTHRCCAEICSFVSGMGIAIESTGEASGVVRLLDNEADADAIIIDDNVPKLFYQDCSKYRCKAMNWGASKGIDDFVDVCVVMNKTVYAQYMKGNLAGVNPKTKNKLYVACTRAHRNLYFVDGKFLEKYKME